MKNILVLLAVGASGLFVLPIIANAQISEGAFINGNIGSASFDQGLIDGHDTRKA